MSTTTTVPASPSAARLPVQNDAAPGPGPKSQKQMSKAERRELQEKQRAAKAVAKADGTAPAKGAAKKDGAGKKEGGGGKRESMRREGASTPSGPAAKDKAAASAVAPDAAARGLKIFSHFALQRPTTSTAKGDVHPAIVRLGLLFSSFRISGANARCIATLSAFKDVIQDYSTPPNQTLARHLTTHLSAQISHLVAARPMSVTMGNAIRQLKLEISGSDIDLPEQDAKDALCEKIDDYIRDRIVIADQVIQETATKKIQKNDVVLTYARSSVVEKVLLQAWEDGTPFSVIVVDSRPMLEGKRLLSVLSRAGIPCTYLLLPALGSIIAEVSTVFLGAHSIHSNGAVYSRAGTALVAMMAKQHSIPVVICCETYKFSENVQLDSFTKNELAPTAIFPPLAPNRHPGAQPVQNSQHLEILNPLYDLTPPASITAVVTEVGVIPPDSISSIPLALGRTMI